MGARANSLEILSADVAAKLALEDRVQAKAGLLPSVNWLNQFIYTQPNGTPCEDGNACTTAQTCTAGVWGPCVGEVIKPPLEETLTTWPLPRSFIDAWQARAQFCEP